MWLSICKYFNVWENDHGTATVDDWQFYPQTPWLTLFCLWWSNSRKKISLYFTKHCVQSGFTSLRFHYFSRNQNIVRGRIFRAKRNIQKNMTRDLHLQNISLKNFNQSFKVWKQPWFDTTIDSQFFFFLFQEDLK